MKSYPHGNAPPVMRRCENCRRVGQSCPDRAKGEVEIQYDINWVPLCLACFLRRQRTDRPGR